MKVALFLEEAELAYEAIPVDTRKGQQFDAAFAKLNPNNKVSVFVDDDATVFDSNAILLYLGEKTGKFMPPNTPAARGPMLSWLMFVASGVGPLFRSSGPLPHRRAGAEGIRAEAVLVRGDADFGIIDARLAERRYMLGDAYTIVALWGWPG
jgi:GST-like protein